MPRTKPKPPQPAPNPLPKPTTTADKVSYTYVVGPDVDNGHTYKEELGYLRQFFDVQTWKNGGYKYFLLDHMEPTKVWAMRKNHYKGPCVLAWEEPPEPEETP